MNDILKKEIISFPHMGNYYSPIYSLLSRLFNNCKILIPAKITKKTMELGEKHSPDFVCTPFKYNLGNFIESLEKGATVLIQAGGGCRFGYYAELQEQILRDLGYNFTFITLLDAKKVDVFRLYKKFKLINPDLKFHSFIYDFLLTIKMINILDKIENIIRENIVFEVNEGEFDKLHRDFVYKLQFVGDFKSLNILYKDTNEKIKNIVIDKNKKVLKVGIIGELYTEMEPFSSFFIERELSKMGMQVKRYTTVTYLLFEKGKAEKVLLERAKKYIKFPLGADGTESVAHSIELCEDGFDGIIHTKPFGCTPEINAIPILQKISRDYNVPIIYFTFDMQTSETGVKTRLEAFYDMIKMKKEAGYV
ncbi:MAG: 2-hydroxyacyl-CoA dehydratase [Clostridia bacterium]|nr:2-hydroxyacyl-CoA dehydratase [Clostridia bacterium]